MPHGQAPASVRHRSGSLVQGLRVLRDRLPERVVQVGGQGGRAAVRPGRVQAVDQSGTEYRDDPGEVGRAGKVAATGKSPKSGAEADDEECNLPDLRQGDAGSARRVAGLPVLFAKVSED